MQIFKAFFKTARRYMPTVLIYFTIFSALAVLLTSTMTDEKDSGFRSVALTVGIIDEDHSDASCALAGYLDTMHNLIPLENKKEVLLDRLFYRSLDYILIIPAGFEKRLSSNQTDALYQTLQIPGVYNSYFIDEQLDTYIKTVRLYLLGGFPLSDALYQTSDTMVLASNGVHILDFSDETKQSDAKDAGMYYFFQYIPYILMSMILCGLTPILMVFWDRELEKRTSCSSLSPKSRTLWLTLAGTVYSLANYLLFLLLAGVIYGRTFFTEQGLLCIVNSFFLLPLSVALALMIGSFSPSLNILNMINNIFAMGLSFLCGIFVPQEQLGASVLSIAKYLPFYWYIKNNNMLAGFSNETFSRSAYWKNCGIQALFVLALFAAALTASKLKSTSANFRAGRHILIRLH